VPDALLTDLRKCGGFTLIEVLIAMVLIAVGLMSVAGLANTTINGNFLSKKIMTATSLSQQKMEYYKGITFSNFTTGTFTEDFGTIPDAGGSTTTYSSYKRVVTIVNGPANNMRTINVNIYRKPDTLTVNVATIMAR
jgi:prepilin-type N-terminal cleavage/methylation domain-containing protein